MGSNFFSALSKKIVATVISIGSLFYSAISGVNAEFDELYLKARGKQLVLSTQLIHCFSEDLDRIFSSGKEIKIYFQVELLNRTENKKVVETTFYRSIHYSLIDRVFTVYLSDKDENRQGLSLEEAKNSLVVIDNYPLVSADQLSNHFQYEVKITAYLGKIRLPGMEEKTNLMFYWNSLKPTVSSEPFSKNIFRK